MEFIFAGHFSLLALKTAAVYQKALVGPNPGEGYLCCMRLRCIKSYTSGNGRDYKVGDIIYWSEYFNLPPGEGNYWIDESD